MSEIELRPLDMSLIDQWIRFHRGVYGQFPWPKPVSATDIVALIESPQHQPFVAYHNQRLIAIASLKVESNSEVLHLADFAALASSSDIQSIIRQIISRAKDLSAKRIWTWVWDSEKALLDALNHTGFVEQERQGLFSLDITKLDLNTRDSGIKIRAISEGISIPDFVRINREAFKDDSSRPLEEKELEEWFEKEQGFHAEFQLAAIMDDKIVGTAMSEVFTNTTNEANHCEAWIYGLGVVETYRRQGIASLLLAELINRLGEQEVKKLWLFTDTKGPIRTFYEHAGFAKEVDWVELDLELDK